MDQTAERLKTLIYDSSIPIRRRSVRIVAHRPFFLVLAGPYITQGNFCVAVPRVTTDRLRETLGRFAEAPLGTEDQP
jgi:hypothetical protein